MQCPPSKHIPVRSLACLESKAGAMIAVKSDPIATNRSPAWALRQINRSRWGLASGRFASQIGILVSFRDTFGLESDRSRRKRQPGLRFTATDIRAFF